MILITIRWFFVQVPPEKEANSLENGNTVVAADRASAELPAEGTVSVLHLVHPTLCSGLWKYGIECLTNKKYFLGFKFIAYYLAKNA